MTQNVTEFGYNEPLSLESKCYRNYSYNYERSIPYTK
jgi:hypothetical protein